VQGWTYDAAGNLTSDGTTTYSYDALGELTGTSAISATRTYSYNGDGTLVAQVAGGTTTSYAQDLAAGQTQVLAATSGSSTTDFLYGDGAARLAASASKPRSALEPCPVFSLTNALSDV
jgi:YD repeat-containing protein